MMIPVGLCSILKIWAVLGFPGGARGREPVCQCRRYEILGFNPWVWKDPLEEGMATQSSILAWRIPWKRSLVGRGPQGRKELDTPEAT